MDVYSNVNTPQQVDDTTENDERTSISHAARMPTSNYHDTHAQSPSNPVSDPPLSSGFPKSDDEEQRNLREALDQSVRETSAKKSRHASKHRNIEDSILGLSNEFSPVARPNGDVCVYIGPPCKRQGENVTEYDFIKNYFSQLHRIGSASIKSLGSDKLNKLLGPKSVRTERRFRKVGIIGRSPIPGVNIFIDLGPPDEDEEAVILLTDLTCTKGILSWHKAGQVLGIPRMLICGKDHFRNLSDALWVRNPKVPEAAKQDQASDSVQGHDEAQTAADGSRSPPGSSATDIDDVEDAQGDLEAEYSPLRHRSAIERLLQAIDGQDPKLNSAPKVWTYFAVARYFECSHHEKISGWITKWLFTGPNLNFIQCNPEVVYRIGLGIMSETLVKDAFSMLVGEKALLNVYGEQDPNVLNPLVRSVHGRHLELLDEDERNRIDHAAASLVRRVRRAFAELVEGQMPWLKESNEYKKALDAVRFGLGMQSETQEFMRTVQDYVRGRIYWVLCRDYNRDPLEFRSNIHLVHAFLPGLSPQFNLIYKTLNQPMRLFTRTFWIGLSHEKLELGYVNTCSEGAVHLDCIPGWNVLAEAMKAQYSDQPEKGMSCVMRTSLADCTGSFNRALAMHYGDCLQMQQSATPTLAEAVDPTQNFQASGEDRRELLDGLSSRSRSGSSLGVVPFERLRVASPKRTQDSSAQQIKRRKVSFDEGAWQGHATGSIPIRGGKPGQSREAGFVDPQSPSMIRKSDFPVGGDYRSAGCIQASARESFKSYADLAPSQETSGSQWVNHPTMGEAIREVQEASSGFYRPATPPPGYRINSPDLAYKWRIPPSGTNDALNPYESPKPFSKRLPPTSMTSQASQSLSGEDRSIDLNIQGCPQESVALGDGADYPLGWTKQGGKPEHHYSSSSNDTTNPSALPQTTTGRVLQDFGSPSQQSPHQHKLSRYLDFNQMLYEMTSILHRKCADILYPPHLFHGADQVPTDLIDHLMCLGEDEWKYLPLWAGGNDDGTGGVFDEVDVPNLEKGGFRGGKRGIGNVDGTPSQSTAESASDGFSDVASEAVSTVGRASRYAAKDAMETVMSLSDTTSQADASFPNQADLWEHVMEMKDVIDKGKGKAIDTPGGTNGPYLPGRDGSRIDRRVDDDRDDSTIMGATSDIQGDMFGDVDDDYETDGKDENTGKRTAFEDSEDSDMEIIDKDDL